LGATLMAQIQFDYGSRHEMVPILMTLAVFVSELSDVRLGFCSWACIKKSGKSEFYA